MPSFIYKNTLEPKKDHHYLKLILKGEGKNTNGIGAKIEVKQNDSLYFMEQQPARGFQSSMDIRPNFGFRSAQNVAIKVTWPSGKVSLLKQVAVDKTITVFEKNAIIDPEKNSVENTLLFTKTNTGLKAKHT